MNRYQYLLLMAACLVLTLPLEVVLGARVWRRPLRLLRALIVPAVIFSLWDVGAIAQGDWRYNPRYVTGWDLPGRLPVEEVVFFLAIPICSLLTFEVVSRILARGRARS
ncbi:MAG: lycopene cyclase domain-containing protein [Acidimicrobiales bacterium]